MTLKRWLRDQEPKWQRLEALSTQAQHTKALLSAEEMREMTLLYLSAVNDLSRAQSHDEVRHLEPYLNSLIQRCHNHVYERPPTRFSDIQVFFLADFPRCFRKNVLFIGLAFLLFVLGTLLALLTLHFHPDTETYFLPHAVIQDLDRGRLWTDHIQANPSQSSFLMTNNIRVAIHAFALGIVFGIGALLLMFYNGLFAFGGPFGVALHHGMGPRLLSFVCAHGVIELSTIFIAGGAGMLIGFAMLFPGTMSRWQAMRNKGREALVLIMGCVPLLVIAGIIEGMVSLNQQVEFPTRVAVAVASAIALIGYFGFVGHKKDDVS